MVNPREDYYAALELRPNADTDEIKKQFKKLGNQPILLSRLLLTDSSFSEALPSRPQPGQRGNLQGEVPKDPGRTRGPI
jgi:hypothetical protein